MSGYSFLAGVFQAYYISLANASFLADFGVDYLPRGYLVTGVVGYLVGFWLSRLQRRLSLPHLLSAALALPLALVFIFRLSFWLAPGPWLTFAMFVCIGPFISLVYFVFRALIGRLFNLRQSKRLFGLISSGDVLSAIIGFFSVPLVILLLGNVIELLIVAGVALALGWFLVMRINRQFATVLATAQPTDTESPAGGLLDLLQDRYLLLIVGMATLVVMGFYYIDYVFLAQVRMRFFDLEFLARFISVLYGIIRVVELIVKTFLSGRLLNNYGLKFGLVALPVLLCATVGPAAGLSLGIVEASQAVFLLVVLSKLIERVGTKSFHDPSFNVLYQPLPSEHRLGVQTRVEGLVQPLAIGLAGGTLWLFSYLDSFAIVMIALALIVVAWTAVALALHQQYRVSLLDNLTRRVIPAEIPPDSVQILSAARDSASGDWCHWLERLTEAIRAARGRGAATAEIESAHHDEDISLVKQHIEGTVRGAAWSMAGLLDVEDEAGVAGVDEVRRALGRTLDEQRENIFVFLSQLYEPRQIELVRDCFRSGDAEGRVYAMEQLDVLVDPGLKLLIFPLLEDLQLTQRLHNLDDLCPQQRLSAAERLCAIVNCEFSRASRWLRACALQALSQVGGGQVYDEQVAHLFNRDVFLRQTAAESIRQIAPLHLDGYVQHVPRMLTPTLAQGRDLALFEQVLLLRQMQLFNSLGEAEVVALIDHSECIRVATGEMLVEAGAVLDCILLLASGQVQRVGVETVDQAPLLLDGWLWTPRELAAHGVRALTDCHLFRVDYVAFSNLIDTWPKVAEQVVDPKMLAGS
ncbi:MAG: hypothetical protein QGH25_02500 [Candidatus Latescibacteria bacterium]|nr:hypothetical protein [Candidatus Latescibacterota bacterium]